MSGAQARKPIWPTVKTSAEPTPGLLHSGRNHANPPAVSRSPKRLRGRRTEKSRPARTRDQAAVSSKMPSSTELPPNEPPGSWRAIASDPIPSASPAPATTLTRRCLVLELRRMLPVSHPPTRALNAPPPISGLSPLFSSGTIRARPDASTDAGAYGRAHGGDAAEPQDFPTREHACAARVARDPPARKRRLLRRQHGEGRRRRREAPSRSDDGESDLGRPTRTAGAVRRCRGAARARDDPDRVSRQLACR